MRKSIISAVAGSSFFLPLVALAAQSNTVTTSQGIIGLIAFANNALNDVIVLLITLAIVVFFWGIIGYITKSGDDKKKNLNTIYWSVIAIFVMVSIWGIIHLLQSTFGISGNDAAEHPSTLQIN